MPEAESGADRAAPKAAYGLSALLSAGRWRMPLLLAALVLPFAATALFGRHALTPLARRAATPLSEAASAIAEALPTPPVVVPLEPTPEAEAIADIDGAADAEGSEPADTRSQPQITQSGIGIGRARVKAAVKAGIRPSGAGVPATSWRPAGLAVYGISAVGVGLRDGDVLTRIGGSPASSTGAVIAAVSAALRRKQPAIVGEVWRGHHRFLVSVELPEVTFEDEVQPPGETTNQYQITKKNTILRRKKKGNPSLPVKGQKKNICFALIMGS